MQEMNAWFTPSSLSARPSQRPELDDPEDEEGMMKAMKYTESLIDDVVAKGIPANRIVLGGFSQGHAMALLTGLTSKKYAGKLGGLIGLCGYLPLAERIAPLRADSGLPESAGGDVPIFVARGVKDMLIPKRYLNLQLEKLVELGVPGELVELHEYQGIGHGISPSMLMDLLAWLEKVIPPVE
jgi:predicted esterase